MRLRLYHCVRADLFPGIGCIEAHGVQGAAGFALTIWVTHGDCLRTRFEAHRTYKFCRPSLCKVLGFSMALQ